MARDRSFWRNVAVIGVLHVAVLSAFVRWSSTPRKAAATNILWMDGGVGIEAASVASVDQTMIATAPIPEPPTIELPEPPADEEPDRSAVAESDLKLPTATPRPKPVTTPKPAPRATPKPSPKKIVVAKASVIPPRPKQSPTTAAKKESEPQSKTDRPAPTPTTDVAGAIVAAAKTGTAPTVGISGAGAGGSGGHGVGSGGASQFGWYAHMLHDRFFSQWAQPTSVVRSGAKMSTLVKLRIEKDGTVSRFTILKPSGNVVVDESVSAVAKRVAHVEALPPGLGDSGFYEVNINFELNSDQ